jgi:hypothetical protein
MTIRPFKVALVHAGMAKGEVELRSYFADRPKTKF